jgi:hypothetical protein
MNWAKLLPAAEFAYNNSKNTTTQISPYRALYGYDPELQFDNVTKGEAPAARDRVERLHELRERLRDEILKAQESQAKYYNQRHIPWPSSEETLSSYLQETSALKIRSCSPDGLDRYEYSNESVLRPIEWPYQRSMPNSTTCFRSSCWRSTIPENMKILYHCPKKK